MSNLYGQLFVEKINAYEWRLIQDWQTPFGIIPAGFVTDGVSNFRLLWAIINPAGRFFEAAIIHDWLLFLAIKKERTQFNNTDFFEAIEIKNEWDKQKLLEAHWAFYEAAIDYGAKNVVALGAYYFIRIYFKYKDVRKWIQQIFA